MKPLKTSVSVTIDNSILDKIRYLAEMDDRSLSSYINQVLKEHLRQLEREKKS